MPKISEIVKFIRTELKRKITKEDEQKIFDKFYPNIKDKVYWYVNINERNAVFFYNGIITKDEYKQIKSLDDEKEINFGEIAKYVDATVQKQEESNELMETLSKLYTGHS